MPRTKKTTRLIPGTRYGRLIILRDEGNPVRCRCDCGKEKAIPRYNLTSGITHSCGCLRSQLLKGKWAKHASDTALPEGSIFGRLHVLESDRQLVRCRCECGTIKWISRYALLYERTSSCGCLNREVAAENLRATATKHGGYGTRTWNCWSSMLGRCENPEATGYERYGGRGVGVCPEWHGVEGFNRFRDHMGEAPSEQHSLDRIDNNRGYEPGNVRWSTPKEQARHRSNNVYVTAWGKTQCLSAWSEETGVLAVTIKARLAAGWPAEKSVSQPTKPHAAPDRTRSGKEKRAWHQMNRRCREKARPPYNQITVCAAWRSEGKGRGDAGFHAFLAHIGPAPSSRHSVDRIDNSRGYEPGNVRWALPQEQARNQTGNLNLTAFGKTQCLAAWVVEVGLSGTLIGSRIARGWSPERALTRRTKKTT